MFTHQEAEEFQSGTIKVTDFKQPEPMRALVRYCYQGQLDDATMDGEWAVEIFKLADRYCVAGLKGQLEKHFVDKRLSKENVVAMAVLADTYTAPKLKEVSSPVTCRLSDLSLHHPSHPSLFPGLHRADRRGGRRHLRERRLEGAGGSAAEARTQSRHRSLPREMM
jgi:hypothetical protein